MKVHYKVREMEEKSPNSVCVELERLQSSGNIFGIYVEKYKGTLFVLLILVERKGAVMQFTIVYFVYIYIQY